MTRHRDIRCPHCAGSGYDGGRSCRWCMGSGLDAVGGSASDASNVVLAALCLLGVIFLALIGAGL